MQKIRGAGKTPTERTTNQLCERDAIDTDRVERTGVHACQPQTGTAITRVFNRECPGAEEVFRGYVTELALDVYCPVAQITISYYSCHFAQVDSSPVFRFDDRLAEVL